MKLELYVPTMVCQVCAENITNAISAVDKQAAVNVDLSGKKVIVETELSESRLTQAIVDVGHEVSPA